MTQVLQHALESLQSLPEEQQIAIASRLLEEIEEAKWAASFARSETDQLMQKMAQQIRAERLAGKTQAIICE